MTFINFVFNNINANKFVIDLREYPVEINENDLNDLLNIVKENLYIGGNVKFSINFSISIFLT